MSNNYFLTADVLYLLSNARITFSQGGTTYRQKGLGSQTNWCFVLNPDIAAYQDLSLKLFLNHSEAKNVKN